MTKTIDDLINAYGADEEPPTQPEFATTQNIVAFLLFSASRAGSWPAWRQFRPEERQHFLDLADKEIGHLAKLGCSLSVERDEKSSRKIEG
ncbi:hypothetical protein [Methylocapsa aurea]|uniref:hypothetical protein n=1 Tax=Methylocapsa aurea TaxID=663610 RepID=UPI0012EB6CAB|nr:hypothetical protein [Methylocapsa aurea]